MCCGLYIAFLRSIKTVTIDQKLSHLVDISSRDIIGLGCESGLGRAASDPALTVFFSTKTIWSALESPSPPSSQKSAP